MIKKPEDNIDASHRLSIENFTIIKKVQSQERVWSSLPEGPGGGGEIHSNGHNLPRHCT